MSALRSKAMLQRPIFGRRSLALGLVISGLSIPLAGITKIENMGVRGNTWTIAEDDAIQGIKNRLAAMKQSGELNRIIKEWQARTLARIESGPDPVPGIGRAMRNRSRLFDPTIVLTDNVKDDEGNIVALAGSAVNPLKYLGLRKEYVLIDGNDRAQVAWATQRTRTVPTPQVLILTAGSPSRLMREHPGIPFFFDQAGRITKRFAITVVPSIVRQSGLQVEIQEVANW